MQEGGAKHLVLKLNKMYHSFVFMLIGLCCQKKLTEFWDIIELKTSNYHSCLRIIKFIKSVALRNKKEWHD